MENFITQIILYILALYGAITLIIVLFEHTYIRNKYDNTSVKLIMEVKDQEDIIEGIVRNIFEEDFTHKVLCNGKFKIIDKGSTDSTYEILEKLKKDYPELEVEREIIDS